MRRARAWLFWTGVVMALLLIGAITTSSQQQEASPGLPSLSAHSSEPDGALALYLWTRGLDRRAEYLEYEPFELSAKDALLVSLRPFDEYDREHVEELRSWLRGGGTLLLGTDRSSGLLNELEIGLTAQPPFTAARPAQPLLQQPPVRKVSASSREALSFDSGVPVLVSDTSGGRPVLVLDRIGQGQVWVFSIPAAFSNRSLGAVDNWKLYLNVVASARPGRVLFDEYHHGRPDIVSIRALIFRERWGWALLYAGAMALGYLVLRGKRLGRPIRVTTAQHRSSGEYVRSLASLLRALGQRQYLNEHYAHSLTQALQQASGLSPGRPLSELRRAAEERTGAPAGKLVEAIEQLGRRDLEVRHLLDLVRAAERERKRLVRRRPW